MKVYEIAGGFGLEALRLTERPQPVPAAGQLLVKVRAVSLNYRDLMVVKGWYNPKMPLPRVPLSDAAGEVVAVGEGVEGFRVGDRVASCFMQDWASGALSDRAARSALGGAIDGVAAEYVLLSEHGAVPLPAHLSFEEGATLPCAAVTAWNALVEGGLTPGQTVLVMGTGGVSLFALQFAHAAGARVLVISSSDDKLKRALEMGAHEGLNYRTMPDWDRPVRELTAKLGVDHVVEVGGAGTLARSMRAVRTGGHIALIGVLDRGAAEVNPLPVLMKGIRMQGVFVGSQEMFLAMNRTIELEGLHPVIDRVFNFDQLPEALGYMESAAHFGKIVLTV